MSLIKNPAVQDISRIRKKECGAFFTPYWIAAEMIRTHNIHKSWASGARILDPTAGDGSLLEALIRCCIEDGIPVTPQMLGRLKGIEKEADFTEGFSDRIRKKYGLKTPASILENHDLLTVESSEYDILLGNPPWLNFTDVKEDEKEKLKEYFVHYGLTEKGKGLLLGGSRIDLAALIIQKALQDHLAAGGNAYFFIPLSLMLNEGAHNIFRQGRLRGAQSARPRTDERQAADCPAGENTAAERQDAEDSAAERLWTGHQEYFSFEEIRDFADIQVFPEVNTRCGFISIRKSSKQKSPVPYYSLIKAGSWKIDESRPVGKAGSAYMLCDGEIRPELIPIKKESRPRQGINTGGRNSLFLFDSCESRKNGLCFVQNKKISALLPSALVFPLLNRRQFRGEITPGKFIFLPYNSVSGRVLTAEELQNYPEALEYLESQRESLESRKGSLLRSSIEKGLYWSLLGVGPYSFSPWKIVWEAYGRDEFEPMIFGITSGPTGDKPWIPNQALQASCSFETEKEALQVLKALKHPSINNILKKQNMEGTCNWAQPGRIRHFLKEI